MKGFLRWSAVALLLTLAVVGGPDLLDLTSPASASPSVVAVHSAASAVARDDPNAAAPRGVERRASLRHLLPVLPPTTQGHGSAPARSVPATRPSHVRPVLPGDRHAWRHLTACSPEALQIFRC